MLNSINQCSTSFTSSTVAYDRPGQAVLGSSTMNEEPLLFLNLKPGEAVQVTSVCMFLPTRGVASSAQPFGHRYTTHLTGWLACDLLSTM